MLIVLAFFGGVQWASNTLVVELPEYPPPYMWLCSDTGADTYICSWDLNRHPYWSLDTATIEDAP